MIGDNSQIQMRMPSEEIEEGISEALTKAKAREKGRANTSAKSDV
jgi:hypothetical protein